MTSHFNRVWLIRLDSVVLLFLVPFSIASGLLIVLYYFGFNSIAETVSLYPDGIRMELFQIYSTIVTMQCDRLKSVQEVHSEKCLFVARCIARTLYAADFDGIQHEKFILKDFNVKNV